MAIVDDFDAVVFECDSAGVTVGVVRVLDQLRKRNVTLANQPLTQLMK